MKKKTDSLTELIMYFSLREREKRKYISYEKERTRLELLSIRELSSHYIDAKSKYEYKKNIFSFFLVSILVAGLVDIWKVFYKFLTKAIQISALNEGNALDITKVSLIIFTIVFITIVSVIFVLLISYLKSIHSLHKQILLMEEVRNSRGIKKRR